MLERWFVLTCVMAALAGSARAASTDTWVGGTGSNFSTTANWTYSVGSGPVASADALVFSGAGATTPNNDETGFTYGGISFSGTTAYGMGGNPFTLASGASIINSGAVTQTLNNNITLSGSGGILNPSVASSGITLGGVISGAANLTKNGNSSSALTLSGVNTFSGVLTFNAGTVVFTTPPNASGGNLGNPSGITFGGSSTTSLVTTPAAGNVTISSPTITANASSTALFKNGGASGTTYEISAKITGAGNCKQNTPITSGAIVRFSGDTSDYTGNFTTAAGVIEYTSVANSGSPSALGAGSTAYAIVNSSSAVTFRYAGTGTSSTTRNIDWQGTTGSFTLDSGATASGPVVAFLGTGNLRSANGIATLSLAGSSTGTNTLAQVINNGTTGSATTVSTSGTGTWILRGANTYSGGTTLNTGSGLGIASSTALGTGAFGVSGNGFFDNPSGGSLTLANAFNLSGGSPTFIGSTNLTINGPVTLSGNNRTITVNAGTLTLGGQITGTFTLTKAGAGTLVLNNPGAADTHNGTLISAGTLDLDGTSQTLGGTVTFSGAATTQNGTITATAYSGTLGSGEANVTAVLAGSGVALSHSGSGTLALLGANTYTGGATISGSGTLLVTNDAGLGSSSGGLLFSASGFLGTSNFNAPASNNVTVGASRTITVNSAVIAGFATLDTNNLTIAAKITGSGGVIKKSSSFLLGNVRFSSDDSDYTGDFTAGFGNTEFTSVADQGTASSLGAGNGGTGGTITLNNATSSGTLRYVGAGDSVTHRPLNWSGTTGTYTLDASGGGAVQFLATDNLRSASNGNVELRLRGANTGSNVLAQVINDGGTGITSLTKYDGGTWVLTAANTFSGGVTNNSGTLLIDGSIGGGGVTNIAGTLGGTGTINCPVVIQSSGILTPGPGAGLVGTLTIDSNLNLAGTVSMVINRTNAQTASLVSGVSTVTYGGTLAVMNSGSALMNGDTFTLFAATNYLGAFASNSLPVLSAGLAWDVSQLPVNGTIEVVALPIVTVSPASTNLVYGNLAMLTANATGSGTLFYQWYDNAASAISGETNSTLTFAPTVAQSGTYSVVVTNNFGSATNTATITVLPAATSLAIGSSTNPALPRANVTFTATISVTAPGAGMPSGGVQFLTNGTAAGGVVPFTGGSAQFSTTLLPHATNTMMAQYAGDANFTGSTNSLSEIVNTPPVAVTANYSRPRDIPLTIKISDLLTNVTDADGDAVALFSFSTNSTNGASISAVSTNGTFLSYTPPSTNGNVTDSFTYTAEDTFGATNTATVVITIQPDDNGQSGNITGLTVLGDGTTQIDFAGIPNRAYLVQAATNLTPTITWTTISTNTAGTNGLFQFIDLDATNFATRYYRTAAP